MIKTLQNVLNVLLLLITTALIAMLPLPFTHLFPLVAVFLFIAYFHFPYHTDLIAAFWIGGFILLHVGIAEGSIPTNSTLYGLVAVFFMLGMVGTQLRLMPKSILMDRIEAWLDNNEWRIRNERADDGLNPSDSFSIEITYYGRSLSGLPKLAIYFVDKNNIPINDFYNGMEERFSKWLTLHFHFMNTDNPRLLSQSSTAGVPITTRHYPPESAHRKMERLAKTLS